MKQPNLLEKMIEWFKHKLVEIMPESLKRIVLYELIDRANSVKQEESERDFWNVTSEEMYMTLRDE